MRAFRYRRSKTDRSSAIKEVDFHFHDTRRHFASWFVTPGGSLQALKEIFGHADLTMTRRYAHLAPEHLKTEGVSPSVQHKVQHKACRSR